MHRITSRLTYANVISSLCLFFLLGGGTAVALGGANTVFSDDIVDHNVRSQDLAKLTFTPVKPNPVTDADPCVTQQTGIFCGHDSVSGLRGWRNLNQGYAQVKYARDGLCIVHLQGTMYEDIHANNTSFILPPGYRPSGIREFIVAYKQRFRCSGCFDEESHTLLQVLPDGRITPPQGWPGNRDGVSLDGIEFKAQ